VKLTSIPTPYAPALGEPSPLLHPVMTTSPNTAGGDCNAYRPSFKSHSTPDFKSTRPSFPNPGAGFPAVAPSAASSASRKCPLPAYTRMQAACPLPIRQPPESHRQSHRRGVLLPEQLTRLGHQPIYPIRSRYVHYSVHNNGHGLRSRLPRTKRPREPQPIGVVRTNLPQRGIPHRAGIIPIRRPIRLGEPTGREQRRQQQRYGKSIHPTTLAKSSFPQIGFPRRAAIRSCRETPKPLNWVPFNGTCRNSLLAWSSRLTVPADGQRLQAAHDSDGEGMTWLPGFGLVNPRASNQ
jgi:hypothetical protein